jgi:DNA-binding transcriptional regulator GbsR (MarR family)
MKQVYSVKDILTAVDNILNVKSTQESKKITNEIPVRDILSAVDNILKVKSIQAPAKEIINEIYQKNDNAKKIAKNPEHKKEDEMKKKYDLLVVNNAKDILILNRIIFK